LKEKELGELDAKWNDLKKKRNESKKLFDEINKNIGKFTPQ
jgi:peptidoglycan hydrolase CwlO-like protein